MHREVVYLRFDHPPVLLLTFYEAFGGKTMLTNDLSQTSQLNILRFLDTILVDPCFFREQVLESLSKIFGYQKSTFWLVDKDKNLYDPLTLNVHENLISCYLSHYVQDDILHPRRVGPDVAMKKNVVYLTDVMTIEDFERTGYYQEFLRSFNLYHELGLYLRDGPRLIGGIALLRSKDEKRFSLNDFRILNTIVKHVSQALASNLRLADVEFQKAIFAAISNQSTTGLIIVDQTCRIHYFNPAVREICAELLTLNRGDNSPEHFVRYFLSKNMSQWQLGLTKTLFSPSLKQFTLQVVPAPNHLFRSVDQHLYLIHLTPDQFAFKGSPIDESRPICNLTTREQELLGYVIRGFTNQEIADELSVSVSTIKKHMQNIFIKTGVRNRTSLSCKFGSF